MECTVLVVDDEENIRHIIRDILEDEGYTVITAPNGVKALNTVKLKHPDIVILDIWMPGIGGMEVLQQLRMDYPEIVVIVITGHGTVDTAVSALKLGAFDYIEKPLSMDKIISIVKKACHN